MRRDQVLVADMLRHARQAARAAAGLTAEQLDADPDRQSMVLWPLIVLGEAAASLTTTDARTPRFPGGASLGCATC